MAQAPYIMNIMYWASQVVQSAYQGRSLRFDHQVRKILWRRKWQPTPVFSHGKSRGQRSLLDPLFFFFPIYFYQLEANYFTILQWSLPYIDMNHHGFTCIPHPDPPSHLPLYSIPLGLPSAPGLSTCLMHPTWAGDLFHP